MLHSIDKKLSIGEHYRYTTDPLRDQRVREGKFMFAPFSAELSDRGWKTATVEDE